MGAPPHPGEGRGVRKGQGGSLLPKKVEAGGGDQVELLEKSMELGKAAERLKGLGAS